MNVLVNEKKNDNYPSLRRTPEGLIVFFSGKKCGITINFSEDYEIGHFREDWNMDRFDVFSGTVELSNG